MWGENCNVLQVNYDTEEVQEEFISSWRKANMHIVKPCELRQVYGWPC